MINTADQTCIVHIAMEQATCRIGGEDKKVLRMAPGFSWAEFGDGNFMPITNPFEQWLLDVTNYPGAVERGQQIYFVIEAGGARGSDGQDDQVASLTNVSTGL